MWEIRANLLLPKAFKSSPKSKKLPNLVTLPGTDLINAFLGRLILHSDWLKLITSRDLQHPIVMLYVRVELYSKKCFSDHLQCCCPILCSLFRGFCASLFA